jgi:hypothetical protein
VVLLDGNVAPDVARPVEAVRGVAYVDQVADIARTRRISAHRELADAEW